jgi:hypothetical protein
VYFEEQFFLFTKTYFLDGCKNSAKSRPTHSWILNETTELLATSLMSPSAVTDSSGVLSNTMLFPAAVGGGYLGGIKPQRANLSASPPPISAMPHKNILLALVIRNID